MAPFNKRSFKAAGDTRRPFLSKDIPQPLNLAPTVVNPIKKNPIASVVKVLTIAVKYGAVIASVLEVLTFALEKLTPHATDTKK
jgi:hypothetical protein